MHSNEYKLTSLPGKAASLEYQFPFHQYYVPKDIADA